MGRGLLSHGAVQAVTTPRTFREIHVLCVNVLHPERGVDRGDGIETKLKNARQIEAPGSAWQPSCMSGHSSHLAMHTWW